MVREQRLIFGEDADLYDAARPSYPAALIDDLAEMAGPAARVLDVGCGTAKATVLLAERSLRGVGVEADPAMAAVARRNLAEYPAWRVDVSDFETWEPTAGDPTGGFDLVTCAQAWHWLNPQVRAEKAHQLLRSGGWLAVWWNVPSPDDSPIRLAMDDIYERLVPELPNRGIGSKRERDPGDLPSDLSFGAPIHRSYSWTMDYTAREWTSLLRTQSDHHLLAPERLAPLLDETAALIEAHGGVYRHAYTSSMWASRKHQGFSPAGPGPG